MGNIKWHWFVKNFKECIEDLLGNYKIGVYKISNKYKLSVTTYEILLYIATTEYTSMAHLIEIYPATPKTLYDSIKVLLNKNLIQILKKKTKYNKRIFSITGLGRKRTYELITLLT